MDHREDNATQPWFSEGLRFRCTGCGACCSGSSGSVTLSQADIARLADHFGQSPGAFARAYTHVAKGRRVLNNRPDSKDCVFLNGKSCQVYEARPVQCRTYPWWLRNLHDEEAWEEAARFCEGINHPTATLVPAEKVIAQYQEELANDASARRR